jgi:hypothetical protein
MNLIMKRASTYLLLSLSVARFGFGAIDIQIASVSALAPNEGDVLLEYVDDFSRGDLINEGSPSLLGWNSTAAFGSGGVGNSFVVEYMNDGIYEGGDKKNTYFDPGHLPAIVTYNLDTSVNSGGYNLTRDIPRRGECALVISSSWKASRRLGISWIRSCFSLGMCLFW